MEPETKLIKKCLSARAKSRLKRNDLVVVLSSTSRTFLFGVRLI